MARARFVVARRTSDRGGNEGRLRFLVAIGVALLLHGLLYFGLSKWSRLQPNEVLETSLIQLRLIDVPALPEPTRPDQQQAPLRREPASRDVADLPAAAFTRLPSSVSRAPQPVVPIMAPTVPGERIFDKEGRAILPQQNDDMDPEVFGSRQRVAAYTANPMVHQSPLRYVPSIFERDWTPPDETLFDEWVRRSTVNKTWDTRGGTRISCSAFLIFFGGCGWGWTPRMTIDELKAMRVSPPLPRNSADDPYVQPEP